MPRCPPLRPDAPRDRPQPAALALELVTLAKKKGRRVSAIHYLELISSRTRSNGMLNFDERERICVFTFCDATLRVYVYLCMRQLWEIVRAFRHRFNAFVRVSWNGFIFGKQNSVRNEWNSSSRNGASRSIMHVLQHIRFFLHKIFIKSFIFGKEIGDYMSYMPMKNSTQELCKKNCCSTAFVRISLGCNYIPPEMILAGKLE